MSEVDYEIAVFLQDEFNREAEEVIEIKDDVFDLEFAKSLQNDFCKENEIDTEGQKLSYAANNKTRHNSSKSLIDPSWEVVDPTPDIHLLFVAFNERFFWNTLVSVCVGWSKRMTSCAGVCSYQGRGGMCQITLSEPLLKLRPRKDLVETLLHEMIHAYLFVTHNNRDRDGHGPEFQKHMFRINAAAGTRITIYHDFHDEVRLYQQHWWKCNGRCQNWKPFYGTVKRSINRAPGPNDFWWAEHSRSCGGTFIKIREPEKPAKKSKNNTASNSKTSSANTNGTSTSTKDIRKFFSPTENNVTTASSKRSKSQSSATTTTNSQSSTIGRVIPNVHNIYGYTHLNSISDVQYKPTIFNKNANTNVKKNIEVNSSNRGGRKLSSSTVSSSDILKQNITPDSKTNATKPNKIPASSNDIQKTSPAQNNSPIKNKKQPLVTTVKANSPSFPRVRPVMPVYNLFGFGDNPTSTTTTKTNPPSSTNIGQVIPDSNNIFGLTQLNSNNDLQYQPNNNNTISDSKENVENISNNYDAGKLSNNTAGPIDYSPVRNTWVNRYSTTSSGSKRNHGHDETSPRKIPKTDNNQLYDIIPLNHDVNCPICNKLCHFDSLNIHLDQCIENNQPTKNCIICKKDIDVNLYEMHVRCCSEQMFDCPDVFETTTDNARKTNPKKQRDEPSGLVMRDLKCDICSKMIKFEHFEEHVNKCLNRMYDQMTNKYLNETVNCLACEKPICRSKLDAHFEHCKNLNRIFGEENEPLEEM